MEYALKVQKVIILMKSHFSTFLLCVECQIAICTSNLNERKQVCADANAKKIRREIVIDTRHISRELLGIL